MFHYIKYISTHVIVCSKTREPRCLASIEKVPRGKGEGKVRTFCFPSLETRKLVPWFLLAKQIQISQSELNPTQIQIRKINPDPIRSTGRILWSGTLEWWSVGGLSCKKWIFRIFAFQSNVSFLSKIHQWRTQESLFAQVFTTDR